MQTHAFITLTSSIGSRFYAIGRPAEVLSKTTSIEQLAIDGERTTSEHVRLSAAGQVARNSLRATPRI